MLSMLKTYVCAGDIQLFHYCSLLGEWTGYFRIYSLLRDVTFEGIMTQLQANEYSMSC